MWAEQLLSFLVTRSGEPDDADAPTVAAPALERLIADSRDLHLELTGLDCWT